VEFNSCKMLDRRPRIKRGSAARTQTISVSTGWKKDTSGLLLVDSNSVKLFEKSGRRETERKIKEKLGGDSMLGNAAI